jgi:hypothetical protein
MKKFICLMFYLGVLSLTVIQAQNEKFKALFMYNFTKYIEWPASQRTGAFIIGVLGNSSMTVELNTIAGKQRVGSQNIVIKTFNSVNDIEDCNILYLPPSKSSLIGEVVNKITGKPILIISDKNGLAAQGACINYVMDGDKLKYEVNKGSIEKRGLTVSSALLALGIVIN